MMDRIDRDLLTHLIAEGRATYQELGRVVRLSPNTVADRVRRLRASGVLTGFHAQLDLSILGRSLCMLSDIRLRTGLDRGEFESGLAEVPQVIAAMRVTGEYDYELRIICAHAAEFETVVDVLKRDHGVRELRSRLMLHEVPLGPGTLVHQPLPH